VAVLAVPLVVALGAIREPTPHSLGDIAQAEMRVRDVPSRHPPLIGLPGRIGPPEDQGSHPGPLSSYALWPSYRLLGETTWALDAAGVVLHVAAIGMALWLAARRGGGRLVLAVAALLGVLTAAYGGGLLTEPWNPYLPVLWWFAFLLAAWSVLCDDLPMLPVAAVTGSFCAQTHLPYAGLVAATSAVVVLVTVAAVVRRPRWAGARHDLLRWGIVAVLVALVAWLPPLLDQFVGSGGNLSTIADFLRNPPDEALGLRLGVEVLLDRLNPWTFLTRGVEPRDIITSGTVLPGLAVLAAWGLGVLTAWRLRHRTLLRLHLVVGTALVAGAVSIGRIFGFPATYLVLWLWGITALTLLATGWSLALLAGRLLPPPARRPAAAVGTVALLAVLVGFAGASTVDATHTDVAHPDLDRTFDAVIGPTVRHLEDGSVPGGGRQGRYLVRWEGDVNGLSLADALLVELERDGFNVGAAPDNGVRVRAHRTIDPADATAEVQLATGLAVARWQARPAFRQVAYDDPRTPAQRRDAGLQERTVAHLRATGLDDLADAVAADDLVTALADERLAVGDRRALTRVAAIPRPVAIFVGPVAG